MFNIEYFLIYVTLAVLDSGRALIHLSLWSNVNWAMNTINFEIHCSLSPNARFLSTQQITTRITTASTTAMAPPTEAPMIKAVDTDVSVCRCVGGCVVI